MAARVTEGAKRPNRRQWMAAVRMSSFSQASIGGFYHLDPLADTGAVGCRA